MICIVCWVPICCRRLQDEGMEPEDMSCISLGCHCGTASCLNHLKLRTAAYPFDWSVQLSVGGVGPFCNPIENPRRNLDLNSKGVRRSILSDNLRNHDSQNVRTNLMGCALCRRLLTIARWSKALDS